MEDANLTPREDQEHHLNATAEQQVAVAKTPANVFNEAKDPLKVVEECCGRRRLFLGNAREEEDDDDDDDDEEKSARAAALCIYPLFVSSRHAIQARE